MALLTIYVVIGAFQSFQRNRDSFERLDFRYQWTGETIVIQKVDPASGAEQAGLQPGDQIWLVGGTPPGDLDGFRRTLRRVGTVPLLVSRGDDTLTIPYTAPGLAIDYHYLFLTFIGFLYLVIGLFTFVRGSGRESSLFYLVTLLTFIVFVYSPAGKTNTTFKIIWLTEEFARIFLPPLTLHFFLRFPRSLLRNRWILGAIYALPVALSLWVVNLLVLGNFIPIASPELSFRVIDRWEMFHFAIYFTAAIGALTWTYRSALVGQKKQIKWIYLGMGAGFIPFLVLYLIPFIRTGADSPYTTLAILPLAFIPLAFAVSILKYKLWDVEVVIKEVLAYTVTFGFGVIAFSTVNVILTHAIEEHLALERNFLAFASGLLIAGILVPMKGRIENVLEMILYRDTWKHRREMSVLAEELATYHDFHELIEIIRERLDAAIELTRMNVYFREGRALHLYEEEKALPEQIPRREFDSVPGTQVVRLDRPRLPEASDLPIRFLEAGYRYLFPVRHRDRLQGILLCGTKRGEQPLSSDDLRLIASLIPSLALAIENARLYGRLRRQIEQIRSLKEYNENIIESSSSAIVVVAADGTVLTANHAFWELAGVDPGTEGKIGDFLPMDQFDEKDGRATEIRFRNRLGEEKEITVSRSAFNAPEAPIGSKVIVMGDVSEVARLEKQLQEKDRLASLGLLAAGIAHEVNTPLTGISSYAQLLLSETDENDPRHKILRKMEQQTFRASRLVNNLLDFASNRRLEKEEVDLAEVIESTVAMHQDLLDSKQINVHLGDLKETLVFANFYEMQQVVTNLLLNARDAVPRDGNVWIDLEVPGDDAVLTVRDDGPGVSPEIASTLFQPLVTTKQGQGGTGLGLAITDRIVRSANGTITCDEPDSTGATFRVVLPLMHRKPEQTYTS
ncbi:MAG: ATP-binding protein [Thermoanaerobaculia bacterium]|nr:ATP-binding protein [Thermoanaerobaculia bacterium]